MDKWLTLPTWVLINRPKKPPNAPKFVCPSPKVLDEKRLHWVSVVRAGAYVRCVVQCPLIKTSSRNWVSYTGCRSKNAISSLLNLDRRRRNSVSFVTIMITCFDRIAARITYNYEIWICLLHFDITIPWFYVPSYAWWSCSREPEVIIDRPILTLRVADSSCT